VVPAVLFVSSLIMALAWLGHLRFKELPMPAAILLAWLLVLPEYMLNIFALRAGYSVFSGGQMAAFRLASGVVCVALVSSLVLGEPLTLRKLAGFALMLAAVRLIHGGGHAGRPEDAP
jgi:uncharacterized protein (DUF486 family)